MTAPLFMRVPSSSASLEAISPGGDLGRCHGDGQVTGQEDRAAQATAGGNAERSRCERMQIHRASRNSADTPNQDQPRSGGPALGRPALDHSLTRPINGRAPEPHLLEDHERCLSKIPVWAGSITPASQLTARDSASYLSCSMAIRLAVPSGVPVPAGAAPRVALVMTSNRLSCFGGRQPERTPG